MDEENVYVAVVLQFGCLKGEEPYQLVFFFDRETEGDSILKPLPPDAIKDVYLGRMQHIEFNLM